MPCWYNCSKKQGIGLLVELHLLAAQLHHSKLLLPAKAQSRLLARASLGTLTCSLQQLNDASCSFGTIEGGKPRDRKRIQAVEKLLQGTDEESIQAGLVICDLPAVFDNWSVGYEPSKREKEEIWARTQGHIKSFISDFVWPYLEAIWKLDSRSIGRDSPH